VTSEQKQKPLKAKVAAALQRGTDKVSSREQIEEVRLLARVLHRAVLGTHVKRHEKATEQLRIGQTEDLVSQSGSYFRVR
jgi:hypothetical protein